MHFVIPVTETTLSIPFHAGFYALIEDVYTKVMHLEQRAAKSATTVDNYEEVAAAMDILCQDLSVPADGCDIFRGLDEKHKLVWSSNVLQGISTMRISCQNSAE